MSESITVFLAGPGASTAHRVKDCPVLERRSIVADEPVTRQAQAAGNSRVTVLAPSGGMSRDVKLCTNCGMSSEERMARIRAGIERRHPRTVIEVGEPIDLSAMKAVGRAQDDDLAFLLGEVERLSALAGITENIADDGTLREIGLHEQLEASAAETDQARDFAAAAMDEAARYRDENERLRKQVAEVVDFVADEDSEPDATPLQLVKAAWQTLIAESEGAFYAAGMAEEREADLRMLLDRTTPFLQHSERAGCPMAFHRSDGERCTCGVLDVLAEVRGVMGEPEPVAEEVG